MDIVLVIVNHRTPEMVANLCSSVARCRGGSQVQVLVVDNGSTEEGLRWLRQTLPSSGNVHILPCDNLGYFGAARRAKAWLEQEARLDPAWMILSNADVEIRDAAFFESLSALAPDFGVIAPSIEAPGIRADQNPFLVVRPRAARMKFYKWLYRLAAIGAVYEVLSAVKGRWLSRPSAQALAARTIYAPHGSFMIFPRRYRELADAFHHGPFLFGEEITVAERARLHGVAVTYLPSLAVRHVGHASLGTWPSRQKLAWLEAATRYCADTYFP